MRALIDDLLLNTRQPIKDDSTTPTPDVVDGGVEKKNTSRCRTSQAIDIVQSVGHGLRMWRGVMMR